MDLIHRAFTAREFSGIPILQQLSTVIHGSVYKTQPFYEALKGNFGNDVLFGGKHDNDGKNRTKVAVTITGHEGKRAKIVANYNRSEESKPYRRKGDLVYGFIRPRDPSQEIRTWEAAAATTAAPPYFKPFYHKLSGQCFLDGAFYNNNPARIVDQERILLWPDVANRSPDIFLSIGTSQNQRVIDKQVNEVLVGHKGRPK
jgi:Patatin-like phospholipase